MIGKFYDSFDRIFLQDSFDTFFDPLSLQSYEPDSMVLWP